MYSISRSPVEQQVAGYEQVGGTAAWWGGIVWLPQNAHMAELGLCDSREQVMTYLMSMAHGLMDEALVRAFVDAAPEVADHREAKTPVRFQISRDFPDHHPEQPGAARS